jgi:3-oxoacyl-[acyl-carrier protein] reductase
VVTSQCSVDERLFQQKRDEMKIDLHGKTALVTGASGELGRAIVLALAHCGADIAIHYYRSKEKTVSLQEQVSRIGSKSCIVQADVTKKESVNTMKSIVEAELQAPDIIVNSAVIQYAQTEILDQSIQDYLSQFESCVLHSILMAQTFVPSMIAKGWGRVIGINTECSMQCFPTQSAYVAGKRGMDGVLRVLAKEVGKHQITVNQVAPGWMISENRPEDNEEIHVSYKEKVPLGRRGTEQDVANVVAFLSSDLANFITGAFIPVCGGNVMPAI